MQRASAWTVRRASPADLPAIVAMYHADGFFHAHGDPERAAYYAAAVRSSGGVVLVATVGADIIGHLELLRCHEVQPEGRYGFVEALEVRADRRHRGVGRSLIEAAADLSRRSGAARLEVWPEDEGSAAFYAACGFRPRAGYVDLDLPIPAADLAHAAPLGRPCSPSDRPWRRLRHVAGRQYPAPYCWARAFLARRHGLPEGDGTGAWHVGDGPAVVMADPWLVHLFLPPDVDPPGEDLWPLWLAMFALRADRRGGYVRTVLAADLAARLGLSERWPGGDADPFTLLERGLSPPLSAAAGG